MSRPAPMPLPRATLPALTVALLTLNHTFGPEYDRALPLLLGIGLVCRNPLVTS